MRTKLAAVILTSSLLVSQMVSANVSPEAAGFLSVVPGLGQVVQGETLEGAAWFAAVFALIAPSKIHGLGRINGDVVRTGISVWQYNVYDAYKDAGARKSSKNNLAQNFVAAYNPLNIIDPIGAPQLALNTIEIVTSAPDTVYRGPRNVILGTIWQTPNAMAEEGLYRGFFFPLLSDAFRSKIAGAVVSSVLFDFGHLLYGYHLHQVFVGSLNNMVNGLLWCWQTDMNRYDLRHSIFTHMWIDALIYYRWNGNLGSGGNRDTSNGGSDSGGGGGLTPSFGVNFKFSLL